MTCRTHSFFLASTSCCAGVVVIDRPSRNQVYTQQKVTMPAVVNHVFLHSHTPTALWVIAIVIVVALACVRACMRACACGRHRSIRDTSKSYVA